MKPDFAAMTKAELRTYVLQNMDDIEAFHNLVDRVMADPNGVTYAPEDAERFPEIYAEHQKRRQERENQGQD